MTERCGQSGAPDADRRGAAGLMPVLVLGLMLGLGGCLGPDPWFLDDERPAAPVPEEAFSAAAYQVEVGEGDTLYGIAVKARAPLRALIDANRLAPPYLLHPGQVLTVPAARTHEVRPGQTLYGISRAYEVDMATLAVLNRLAAPYGIRAGQRLQLPAQAILPGAARTRRVRVVDLPPPSVGEDAPVQGGAALAVPALAGRPRFDWPARGQTLSGFGPAAGGVHNDGVNIAVPEGSPVRAAGDGRVIYADDALKGYGNLLLIRHDGGWITAYAHNARLLVRRGERVRRGQTVAHAGSTGGVSTPQVHFEIRKGTQALDPASFTPGGAPPGGAPPEGA